MATIVYVWLVLACPQPWYPQHLAVPMANLTKNNEDDSGHPFDGARLLDFAILRPYLQHPAVSHDPSSATAIRANIAPSFLLQEN